MRPIPIRPDEKGHAHFQFTTFATGDQGLPSQWKVEQARIPEVLDPFDLGFPGFSRIGFLKDHEVFRPYPENDCLMPGLG